MRPWSDWYSEDIRQAQIERRRLEREWKCSGLCVHKEMLRAQCNVVYSLVRRAKNQFYSDQVAGCEKDQKQLYRIVNSLIQGDNRPKLPVCSSTQQLVETFNAFSVGKVAKIQNTFSDAGHLQRLTSSTVTCVCSLDRFIPPSWKELTYIMRTMPKKFCSLDPIPASVIQDNLHSVLPALYKTLCGALCNPASSLRHSKLHWSRHFSRGLAWMLMCWGTTDLFPTWLFWGKSSRRWWLPASSAIRRGMDLGNQCNRDRRVCTVMRQHYCQCTMTYCALWMENKPLCWSFWIYLQRSTAWTTVSCWSGCLLLTELRDLLTLARVVPHRADPGCQDQKPCVRAWHAAVWGPTRVCAWPDPVYNVHCAHWEHSA